MTSRASETSLAAAAFLFVGVLGTVLPAELPAVRVAAQLALAIPLAAWAVARLGRPGTPLRLAVVVALALFFGTAVFSRDQQGSFEMLGGALVWALLFWAMADLQRPSERASIAVGAFLALTAWLWLLAGVWTLEKVRWVAHGGGIPNLVESTQTLAWLTSNVIPVLVLLGIGLHGYLPRTAASRTMTWLFVVAAAVTVPMSGGRAGWLGLAVCGVVLLALRGSVGVRLTPRRALAGAAAVAGAAAIASVTVGGRVVDAAGVTARMPLWSNALAIFADDPLTGGGPGTYSWLRLEHVEPYHAPVRAVLAHNVVLQTLADGGLLLLAALSIAVSGVAVSAWRRRDRFSAADRTTAAVLVGFGVVCMLDDHSSLPAIIGLVITLAAWLVRPSARNAPAGGVTADTSLARPRLERVALVAAVVLFAIPSLPAVYGVDSARIAAASGRQLMFAGDYARAATAFGQAIRAYPERPNYHLSAGMALALNGETEAARIHYREAAALAPADARAWGALSVLAATAEERLAFARRAAMAPSVDARYAFVLGEALAASDDPEARLAFARAVARSPGVVLALRATDPLEAPRVVSLAVANSAWLAREARTPADWIGSDLVLAGFDTTATLAPAWRAVRAIQHGDLVAADGAVAAAIEVSRFAVRTWEAARIAAAHRCDDGAAAGAAVLAALSPGGRDRPRDELVYRTADLAYREAGIASYQPVPPPYDPDLLAWPDPYLAAPPECAR